MRLRWGLGQGIKAREVGKGMDRQMGGSEGRRFEGKMSCRKMFIMYNLGCVYKAHLDGRMRHLDERMSFVVNQIRCFPGQRG